MTSSPLAMDGKDIRGASKQTEDGRRMTAAAVEHGTGTAPGQVEVDAKSNEIPAVRDLAGQDFPTLRLIFREAEESRPNRLTDLSGG